MLLVGLALASGHGSEARQARSLSDAATLYWEGVRWNDAGKASPFLIDLEARVRLTQILDDAKARLTGATVIQVALGVEPKGDAPRPALVLVRLELIDVARNRYETLDYAQHWEEVGYSWLIDSELSPLGTDRPWVIEPVQASPAK